MIVYRPKFCSLETKKGELDRNMENIRKLRKQIVLSLNGISLITSRCSAKEPALVDRTYLAKIETKSGKVIVFFYYYFIQVS